MFTQLPRYCRKPGIGESVARERRDMRRTTIAGDGPVIAAAACQA